MGRVMADQNITCLRHLVDRGIAAENVAVCGIEAEIRHPGIAYSEGEPVSIGVRKAGSPKLIGDWRWIEGESTTDDPARVWAVSRSDTPEPSPMPLLRLVDQAGAVGPFNTEILDDAPIGPLSLGQQGNFRRDLMICRQTQDIGRATPAGSNGLASRTTAVELIAFVSSVCTCCIAGPPPTESQLEAR
jgi:hypothetical protein